MATGSSSNSKKRPFPDAHTEGPSAKKVWPIFSAASKVEGSTFTNFRWLPKLSSTCWTGENGLFECRPKIAFFDLDGTVLQSPGGFQPIPPDKWKWWSKNVPGKLKELNDNGHSIVFISNQGSSKHIKNCEAKLPRIAIEIPDIPFRVFAASTKDQFRKPRIGTFKALEALYSKEGVAIDLKSSFFVGDAAGRRMPSKANSDHSDCDIKYAENVGVKFFTPEEYFLSHPKPSNIVLAGFHPKLVPSSTALIFTPTSSPLLPPDGRQELIIFVGLPALGKSHFYRKHLASAGYSHVNQDTLKSLNKCIKVCSSELQEGRSIVIDNTNRNISTRAQYIKLAKELKLPVRCFWFSDSVERARHNNLYRSMGKPLCLDEKRRELLPEIAFSSFFKAFEQPTTDEGFDQIKEIHWVFDGTKEEEGAYYMWYS